MITFLEGTLVEKQPARVVLNVGGVGYEVLIPLSSYDRLGGLNTTCRILTHHYVREDAELLYGFVSAGERRMFELLLTISGIGPKIALTALSGLSVRELKAAVAENDVKRLSSISGIGRKTAERMVIELRDKLTAGEALEAMTGADEPGAQDVRLRDSVLALIQLGYKQVDAQTMIRKLFADGVGDAHVEEIVRRALTSK
jgi:holliday junction DNA helicase RuvA